MILPMSLRTDEMEAAYQQAKLDKDLKPLLEEQRIEERTYWVIVKNRFPYNKAFKRHDLFVLKRQVVDGLRLTVAEAHELELMKIGHNQTYDVYFTNTPKKRSVLGEYHVHAGEYYDNRI